MLRRFTRTSWAALREVLAVPHCTRGRRQALPCCLLRLYTAAPPAAAMQELTGALEAHAMQVSDLFQLYTASLAAALNRALKAPGTTAEAKER